MFTEQCEASVVRVVSKTASEMVSETAKPEKPAMHPANAHDDITQVSCQCKTFYP